MNSQNEFSETVLLVKVNNKIRSIFVFIMAAALTLGCSNRRNTSATRAYHQLTTRYNIYHNALQTYNQLLEEQYTTSSVNWFNLLTIHPNEVTTNKTTPGGPFDVVIEKTTTSIIEHSITSKPVRDPSKAHSAEYRQWLRQEEFNPYLKNSWLLMGKAYVQNHDYNEALSVFAEIQRIYPNDINLISETQLWMLRSYTALNRMYDAQNMIYLLQSRQLPTNLKKLYNQEYANYLIKNKQLREAIPYLKETINNEKIYLQKKRLQFLLGQIYILLEDNKNAYNSFDKIKSLRTPPQLNKNASIYQAVVTNNSKQHKFYNDSLAQLINSNIQLIDNDIPQTTGHPSNIYAIQPVVRVKTYTPIENANTNKSEISRRLNELMNQLNQLNTDANLTQKVVPLNNNSSTTAPVEREKVDTRITPEELKAQLEQKAEEALKQSRATSNIKNREQQLKEREKLRETRLKEREKELRERERRREAQLRQREKEREERIREQKR